MDQSSFDRIARVLGGAASRRAGLRAALGGLLGLSAAMPGMEADAKAAPGRDKRKDRKPAKPEGPCGDRSRKDNLCTKDSQCCTGYCKRGLKNIDGKGRCRCLKKNKACKPNQTCCGRLSCSNGRCRGPIPTGQPCTAGDTCADALATCTTYRLGAPAGTYCLLPDAAACGDDDAFCASSFCGAGVCASCTVCAAGCPFPTISAAYAAASAGAVIGIAPGAYDESIEGIDRDVTFRRCGRTGVVAWTTTTAGTTLLEVDTQPVDLVVRDIEFSASGAHGIVLMSGDNAANLPTLTASNCRFHDTACDSYQSPVTLTEGAAGTFTDCSFEDNTGDSFGGAIQVYNGGSLTVTGCQFSGNASKAAPIYSGGAIGIARDLGVTDPVTLTVSRSTFTANHTDSYGGGINGDSYTTATITDCAFTNNTAKGGAGINMVGMASTFTNCTFTGNQAQDSGGGLVLSGYPGMTATLTTCTFTGNSAGNSDGDSYSGGGAILLAFSGAITLQDCTITGNTTKTQGGGILVGASDGTNSLTLTGNTVISGNSVTDGAAGAGSGIAVAYNAGLSGSASVTGAGTRVSGNTTPPTNCATSTDGGATYVDVPGCLTF
ncbi:MAG: right-handed parallel beta-helix repeat-containing protein [Chloroflexota bacterium]